MRGLLVSGVLVLCGCATSQSAQKDANPVVATYGGKSIRLNEVDAKIADELLKLHEQIHELREEAAERIAIEALVGAKSLAAGQTEDEWLAGKIERELETPSDEDMRALFQKARGSLPAQVTYEDVKNQLIQALSRESRGRKAKEVFGQLKKEAGFVFLLDGPEKERRNIEPIGPSRGNAVAPVVIVEFADFECRYCATAHETVKDVLGAYGDKVRLVFRHYPLSFHLKAPKAAQASICADEQGKFWEMHDSLFESQALEIDALRLQAQRVGLDSSKFESCLQSGRAQEVLERDIAAGQKAGVSGTPAFFVNGLMLTGAQPEDAFRKVIDAELSRLDVK